MRRTSGQDEETTMITTFTTITFALLTSSVSASASASASAAWPPAETTTWGTPVPAGDGTIQSFLTTTEAGEPEMLGVQLSLEFDTLPPEPGEIEPGYEYAVPLPKGAAELLPFDHVTADWNPHGHIPPGVYDVPHVDIHFYMISMDDRSQIIPGNCANLLLTCDALERAVTPLAPAAWPPFHVNIGAVAPFMGNHLIDLRGPEFGPEGFTNAFLFGAWDGQIAFLEPMISVAHFESLIEDDCRTIANPETFAAAGWYPTVYCVRTDDRGYSVTLESFERFEATR
jgi:hypothetical protein